VSQDTAREYAPTRSREEEAAQPAVSPALRLQAARVLAHHAGLITVGLATLGILLIPQIGSTHHTLLMLSFFSYGLVALGLNLLFGYTGLLSFGHALFLSLGTYTAAFTTHQFGIRSMEIILLLAALISALVAMPIGALCVRYVKIYFSMLTLAFGMLFWSFLIKFSSITGGDQGILIKDIHILGTLITSRDYIGFLTGPYYYYSATLVIVLAYVMWRIVHSPFGLCLRSIRDNPIKAESLGISVKRYRWYAFLISAVYAAIGGVLLAPVIRLAEPTLAYWTQSGFIVFMTLLGAFNNFFGPLLGTFVFIYLQDWVMSLVPYWRFVFGAILLLLVIFAPTGLVGILTSLSKKLRI
jgi:branched-chain amino acid transport system permease protein